eukprot:COSAG01_NODE_3256_length_6345_cov_15.186359_7_plen_170_part_00
MQTTGWHRPRPAPPRLAAHSPSCPCPCPCPCCVCPAVCALDAGLWWPPCRGCPDGRGRGFQGTGMGKGSRWLGAVHGWAEGWVARYSYCAPPRRLCGCGCWPLHALHPGAATPPAGRRARRPGPHPAAAAAGAQSQPGGSIDRFRRQQQNWQQISVSSIDRAKIGRWPR